MSIPIASLIDKRDTLEIVRDAIASILAVEFARQQSIAVADGRDPRPWALRVFADRARPWPHFLDQPAQLDGQPVCNVLIDHSTVDGAASGVVRSQAREVTFWIDCYGYGLTQADGQGGHVAGDRVAALECQRAARLVRNVLMGAAHVSLGLTGLVWRRMVRGIEAFDPAPQTLRANQNVLGVRVSLEVMIGEVSPQHAPTAIESIRTAFDDETGEVLTAQWPVSPYVPELDPPWSEPPLESAGIHTLIDAPDTFEVVRAQIANVLAAETASQQALAVAQSKDPAAWTVRVFEERTNPWGAFLDASNQSVPIVNVQLAALTLHPEASGVVERQVYTGRYTVDVYASGQSAAHGGGHVAGDELAARRAERGARFVRNVLMSAHYVSLGLGAIVGQRMIASSTRYRPDTGGVQNVAVIRLDLDVRFAETAPQVDPVIVRGGVVPDVLRADTGEVIVSFGYPVVGDYPVTLAANV